jgi:hypothetical protein
VFPHAQIISSLGNSNQRMRPRAGVFRIPGARLWTPPPYIRNVNP